jgi:uncharacterized repeat protein (TIGR02543 family)
VVLPTFFVKEGFNFGGLYDNAAFTGDPITEIPAGNTDNWVLYVKWIPQYTITYNLNGIFEYPAGMTPPTTYTIESSDIIIPNPTYIGSINTTGDQQYTVFWLQEQLESGRCDISEYGNIAVIPHGSTGNISLKAMRQPFWYINYELNGGTNPLNVPTTYLLTQSITLPIPTRDGYNFVGWYYNPQFTGNPVVGSTLWRENRNLTLYAKWNPIQYSIIYNLDNYGTMPAAATYNIDSATITLPIPTKDAYTFDGWYDNAEFTGTAVTEIPAGSTGNKTFYAKWIRILYQIVYIDDGIIVAVAMYNITQNTLLMDFPYPKYGYTFVGWYDNAALTGTAVTEIPAGRTVEMMFYAKWNLVKYSITYNLNEGTMPAAATTYNTGSATITLPTPTKDGYTFDGWYNNAEFTGTAVTEIPAGSTGNRTFYAKWNHIQNTNSDHCTPGTNPAAATPTNTARETNT